MPLSADPVSRVRKRNYGVRFEAYARAGLMLGWRAATTGTD